MPATLRRTAASSIALSALGGVSLLFTLAGCAAAGDATAEETPATEESSAPESSGGPYADGDYSATGDYQSPGGAEEIDVELTLAGHEITAVTVTPTATSGQAERYQTEFADGISAEVVGKKIDDISVDKVAGSSLTGDGFNAAIDKIKADAAG